jgi:hypothetical protein
VIIGVFSRKGAFAGARLGLRTRSGRFFAYLILLMNPGHVLNIMLPGSLVGLIVGYVAQSHNRP